LIRTTDHALAAKRQNQTARQLANSRSDVKQYIVERKIPPRRVEQ